MSRIQALAALVLISLLPMTAAAQTASKQKSLYDRLGGTAAITAVVDEFVGRREESTPRRAWSDAGRYRGEAVARGAGTASGVFSFTICFAPSPSTIATLTSEASVWLTTICLGWRIKWS